MREILVESKKRRFSQKFNAKIIIATGARATPIIEISPALTTTSLGEPLKFAKERGFSSGTLN